MIVTDIQSDHATRSVTIYCIYVRILMGADGICGLIIIITSGPKFTILWGHVEDILLLNKFFFRLSLSVLVAKT